VVSFGDSYNGLHSKIIYKTSEVRELRFSFAFLAALSALLFLANLSMSVYGSEKRPDGVERIRAYCLWDNNNDTVVDEGAKQENSQLQ